MVQALLHCARVTVTENLNEPVSWPGVILLKAVFLNHASSIVCSRALEGILLVHATENHG